MMQHEQSSIALRAGAAASKHSRERAASCPAGVSPILCNQRASAALRAVRATLVVGAVPPILPASSLSYVYHPGTIKPFWLNSTYKLEYAENVDSV